MRPILAPLLTLLQRPATGVFINGDARADVPCPAGQEPPLTVGHTGGKTARLWVGTLSPAAGFVLPVFYLIFYVCHFGRFRFRHP